MRVRRDNVSTLARAIVEIHELIAKTVRERDQHAELGRQAETDRRASADDPPRFAELGRKAATHRVEAERLALVLERRRADLVEHERRLEHARFANAYDALSSAAERRQAAASKLSSALGTALKALAARDAAHEEFEAAFAHARELCPTDELDLPDGVDEPEFPSGVDRLAKALQAGPRRPRAKSAASRERRDREAACAEAGRVPKAVREALELGDFDRLRRLSSERLPAAAALAQGEVEERRARVPEGRPGREIAAVLESRLESIRELAAQAMAAA